MYGHWGKCHRDGIGELLRYQLKEALVLIQAIKTVHVDVYDYFSWNAYLYAAMRIYTHFPCRIGFYW